jgi:hypothetical protein
VCQTQELRFTKFNLEDLKEWKPLFTKKFTHENYRDIAGEIAGGARLFSSREV